jgi:biotin carboxylase
MPYRKRVLVVGTTADYVDWIESHYPGSALFLTAPEVRRGAREPMPAAESEIVCQLADYRGPRARLADHLATHSLQLSGVVSYDCESLELGSDLARRYYLPYPSKQAVGNCRNKFRTKSLWQAAGLDTPAVSLVESADDALAFMRKLQGPCVLKPLSGSGSELIFDCHDETACEQNFSAVRQGLQHRATHRLYQPYLHNALTVLAEQWVAGDEYSCDFIFDQNRIDIIRLTRKIPAPNGHFGTTLGYAMIPEMEDMVDKCLLADILSRGCQVLGLTRAICMVDFIMQADKVYLLELSPRPGGDCLPALLRIGLGFDILKLAMDFASREPIRLPPATAAAKLIGLRLLANTGGRLKRVDAANARRDRRVREIAIARRPGQRIEMPPLDYDSWVLGHIIFEPEGGKNLEEQCRELSGKIVVEVE